MKKASVIRKFHVLVALWMPVAVLACPLTLHILTSSPVSSAATAPSSVGTSFWLVYKNR